MVQLLANKLASLSKELDFDWQKEANYIITAPPGVSSDQDDLSWKQNTIVAKATCLVSLVQSGFRVINIEKLFPNITENLLPLN
jgi:hypothetical protein